MNKRLAWNFEINSDSVLTFPTANVAEASDSHWESRFFWSDRDIITLSGLDEHFLELSRYKIKHHTDCYHVLPDADYNLKTRHDEITYKPIIQRTKTAIAYGKKIKIATCLTNIDGVAPHTLIQRIKTQAHLVYVDKEALIYTLQSHPSSKLELARLSIGTKIYYSVSVESPALSLVEQMTQQIIANSVHCDYVTFLKNQTSSS